MKRGASPLRVSSLAFAISAAALLALIAQRLYVGTEADRLLQTAPQVAQLTPFDIKAESRAVELSTVRDQAVFYASRRFYVAPPPPPAPLAPPKPDYRLTGVLMIPGKAAVALLANAEGATRKVKEGDVLDGWSVRAVEQQRVLLRYNSESAEILKSAIAGASGLTILSRASSSPAAHSTGLRVLGSSVAMTAGETPSMPQPNGPGRVRYAPAPNFRAPQ